MSEFTNILDLPTEPLGGTNLNNNISLNASEKSIDNITPVSNISLDQSTINQIVNGLQQATISGATQLPSRDISMETVSHSTDKCVQPNYIPMPAEVKQYITEDFSNIKDDSLYQQKLDNFYDEIQMPLLLAVLYFFFQLPIIKKYLSLYLPILLNDGNYNLYGLLFTSSLFSMIFYFIHKVLLKFNT